MRIAVIVCLLSCAVLNVAQCQELAKVKVAVVRVERLMGHETGGYERLRLLTADKEQLEAIKKINAEVKAIQKELLDVEDELKMAELGKRLELLNRKRNLLQQRMFDDSGWKMQKIARDFIVENYRNQYQLIVPDRQIFDRVIYKEGVEIVDITEEAAEKFRVHLDQILGE